MSHSRFDGIQVLRGVAAFLVLIVHAGILTPVPKGMPYFGFFNSGGAVGVDLFFVISGFVVAMAAQRSNVREFALNRATRVLPLYVALSIPLIGLAPMSAVKWWNTIAFVPAFDFGRYTNPAHSFGWTIGLELWFYVVMAFAMFAGGRRFFTLFTVTILCLVFSRIFYGGDWLLPIFLGHPMALEFLAGVGLFIARRSLKAWIGPPLIFAGCWIVWEQTNEHSYLGVHSVILAHYDAAMLRAIAWGTPCAMIVAGFVACNDLVRWPRVLKWFGDISYSFYMVQPISMLVLDRFDFQSWSATLCVFFFLNLGLAAISHRYIEIPLTQRLRRKSAAPRPVTTPST